MVVVVLRVDWDTLGQAPAANPYASPVKPFWTLENEDQERLWSHHAVTAILTLPQAAEPAVMGQPFLPPLSDQMAPAYLHLTRADTLLPVHLHVAFVHCLPLTPTWTCSNCRR